MLSALRECSVEPQDAVMYSYQSEELSRTNLRPNFQDTYGSPYFVTHRADLQRVLASETARLGVTLHLNAKINMINFERTSIIFSDGTARDFDVILGADGEKSFSREQLLGREDPLEDSGFEIYRTTVECSDLAQRAKLKELIDLQSINLWIGPDAHAVTYPIHGGDVLNIVLTRLHGTDAPVNISPVAVEKSTIEDAFVEWGSAFHELLDTTTNWNMRTMMYSKECNTWVHPKLRFALIGDAAHASPPYLYVFSVLC
jgi:salicylate hydroxylase